VARADVGVSARPHYRQHFVVSEHAVRGAGTSKICVTKTSLGSMLCV